MAKIGIYKITNKINGKCYIGQSKNIYKRWKSEQNGYVNEHLKSAFTKYGIENFSFEILEECDVTLLNERETYYINHFDSCNREKGYNIMSVGCVPIHNLPLTENHKQKISLANKGRKLSKETIEKQKEAKKHTVVCNQQVVYCYETNLYYKSINEAARKLNLAKNALRRVVRGMENRVKDYHFCTIDDDINSFIEKCDEIYNYINENGITLKQFYTRKSNKYSIKIKCIETGIEYESINDASRKLSINKRIIKKSLTDETYTSMICPYHFKYMDEKYKNRISLIDEEKQKEINLKISAKAKGRKHSIETIKKLQSINTGKKLSEEHKKHISESCKGMKMPDSQKEATRKRMINWHNEHNSRKPVRCIETGKEWESVDLAEKETGLQVSRCCIGRYLNSGNLHFEFVDETERNKYADKILELKQKWLKTHHPVMCINNGKIYKTNCEAEKELGTEHHKITDSCNKHRACKDGYSYRWLTDEEIANWIVKILI